ncbi:hypothetical protein ABNF65_23145, partial [Paenibacillus larvae]
EPSIQETLFLFKPQINSLQEWLLYYLLLSFLKYIIINIRDSKNINKIIFKNKNYRIMTSLAHFQDFKFFVFGIGSYRHKNTPLQEQIFIISSAYLKGSISKPASKVDVYYYSFFTALLPALYSPHEVRPQIIPYIMPVLMSHTAIYAIPAAIPRITDKTGADEPGVPYLSPFLQDRQ